MAFRDIYQEFWENKFFFGWIIREIRFLPSVDERLVVRTVSMVVNDKM
jgi:hypothetical protein